MIIDIHGHSTTAPKALEAWRNRQIAGIKSPAQMPSVSELRISHDEIRESAVRIFDHPEPIATRMYSIRRASRTRRTPLRDWKDCES